MAKAEIIKAPKFEIAAMDTGIEDLRDLVTENVGPEGISAFDLSRAINPTGKNTKFEIPGLEDESEMVRELEGIILYHRLTRVYYPGAYKSGGSPPECSSADSLVGEGNPGGDCSECPFAKFGSGENNSQACRVIKQIFMLRSGELLPTLVNVTSVNVKHPKKYMLDLLSKRRLRFNQVITKIRLEPDTSASNFDYARTDFSLVNVLEGEQKEFAHQMTALFRPMFEARPITIDVTPDAVAAPGETFNPDGEEVPY